MKKQFYRCVCGCKILMVSHLNEDYTQPTELELAIYSYGTEDYKTSIIEKLRWCWKILTTGRGWSDQIILQKKDIKKLINVLNKASKEIKGQRRGK